MPYQDYAVKGTIVKNNITENLNVTIPAYSEKQAEFLFKQKYGFGAKQVKARLKGSESNDCRPYIYYPDRNSVAFL